MKFLGVGLAVLSVAGSCWSADIVMSPQGEVTTFSQALARIRLLRRAGQIPSSRAAEVEVQPGRYAVTEPTIFESIDGGVHFTATESGAAIFDGGVTLPPFVAGSDGIWRTKAPADVTFEKLYVNGRRAQRARTPNAFFLYMDHPVEAGMEPVLANEKRIDNRAFYANPKDLEDVAALPADEQARVQIAFYQSWDMGWSHLQKVDGRTGLVLVDMGTKRSLYFWNKTQPRYVLENYRAALDAPGEWFWDRKAGEILYLPRAGETVEQAAAVVPVTSGFVTFAADAAKGEVVRDVVFEGLAFEHCGYVLPAAGVVNSQSAQNVPEAAITGCDVEDFVLRNCRLSHLGAHGVWLRRGSRRNVIEHCLIEDLGAGGVYLGDTSSWRQEKPDRIAGFNRVHDCIIRTGGRLYAGAIGVWVGHASDNEISHNDIGDFRYSGVSMGWTWGYAPTVAKRNHLLWNRIHHIGWGLLSDMGGVYTLGDSEGTEEIGNWIHDVNGYAGSGSPAWGLYTDEGSAHIRFASNLVERCRDGAVHQHYGKENLWENNLFLTFQKNGFWRSRSEDHCTVIVSNNVFYWTEPAGSAFWSSPRKPDVTTNLVFDGNLYWGAQGVASNAFNRGTFAAWQAAGQDRTARVADPKFVNPAKGDWRMAADSPARAMGFVPWDWTEAGVLKADKAWRAAAMDDGRYPPLVDAPAAPVYHVTRYRQNFEGLARGATLLGSLVSTREGICVTRTAVRHGTQALKLVDGPMQKVGWAPHVFTRLSLTSGVVRVAWSYRTDTVAQPMFEIRDYASHDPYASALQVVMSGGKLRIGKTLVAQIPPNTWCDVELILHLTGPRARTWVCKATPVGGTPGRAEGRVTSPHFRNFEWAGFMTPGSATATWYLDDFEITPVTTTP